MTTLPTVDAAHAEFVRRLHAATGRVLGEPTVQAAFELALGPCTLLVPHPMSGDSPDPSQRVALRVGESWRLALIAEGDGFVEGWEHYTRAERTEFWARLADELGGELDAAAAITGLWDTGDLDNPLDPDMDLGLRILKTLPTQERTAVELLLAFGGLAEHVERLERFDSQRRWWEEIEKKARRVVVA